MRKYFFFFILVSLWGCVRDRTQIELIGFNDEKEVIFLTPKANFHIRYNDLIKHCNKEKIGEANDFIFNQIIDYISTYPNDPILIPDTLGTIEVYIEDTSFDHLNNQIRLKDQNHPYAEISGEMNWVIIKMIENGKMKIYSNSDKRYVKYVFLDVIETNQYGSTEIRLANDSLILSQIRWIK